MHFYKMTEIQYIIVVEVISMLDKKTLGKLIQHKRKELGITQTQVSEATELSRNYISDIENGRYKPSVDSLSKIAIFLNLDLNLIKMTEIQVMERSNSSI
jgi:transcriptional regulator with XRE-family HTH domain